MGETIGERGRRMKYDLIVIGGGVAGEKGAAQAAYFGKRVALVERSPVCGGTVANASIPFNALRETALYLAGFRNRKLREIDLHVREKATLRDFLSQEHALVRDFRGRLARNLDDHSIGFFPGEASFVDPHTIRVEHRGRPPITLSADVILIACGSRPYHPPQMHVDHNGIYDSDSFIRANCMPERLSVIGAGATGCEYAGIMRLLGCQVSLIHAGDVCLPFLDFGDLGSPAAEPHGSRHRPDDVDARDRGPHGAAIHAIARRRARTRSGRDRGDGRTHRQHRRPGAGERRARARRARPPRRQRQLADRAAAHLRRRRRDRLAGPRLNLDGAGPAWRWSMRST